MKFGYIFFCMMILNVTHGLYAYTKACFTPQDRKYKAMQYKKPDYVLYNVGGRDKDCYVMLTPEEKKQLLDTLKKSPKKEVTKKVINDYLVLAEFKFIGQVLQDFFDKRKQNRSEVRLRPLTFGDVVAELELQGG